MICPTCGNDAGSNLTCVACGNPVAPTEEAMSAHDDVIWSADEPPTAVTPAVAATPSAPGAPRDPTAPSGGQPRPPKDPTSPSASRPRPPKEVLLRRRVVIGGSALLAVVLLIVILVVTVGGGSDKSASQDSVPTSDVSGPTDSALGTGPSGTDSVSPSSVVGASGVGSTESLSKGSTGPVVSAVQQALLYRNYEVTVSGVFDDATVTAVKKFQKDINLPVVGKAGPATRAALGLGELRDTEFSSYKQAVTAVVTYLNKGTYGLLPKDALKLLYAFRQITKGKRIVWSLENLEVARLVAEPPAGQGVAALKLLNQSTKKEYTLTLCFTQAAPIQWCGLWFYE